MRNSLQLRKKLIAIAAAEVGVREEPRNSNRGPRVQEYQRATNLGGTGWAWCAAFVCWCVQEWGKDPEVRAELELSAANFERWRPKTPAAYGFDDWAEQHGLLIFQENSEHTKAVLHTGDIVTYDFSHIGIVDTDTENGTVMHTIEGNTDEAGSREGGGVYRKDRARSLARTIIRILP